MKEAKNPSAPHERAREDFLTDAAPAPPELYPKLETYFRQLLEEHAKGVPDATAQPAASIRAETLTDVDGPDGALQQGSSAAEATGDADARYALLSRRVRRVIPAWSPGKLLLAHNHDTLTDPALSWHEWGLLGYLTFFGGHSIPIVTLVERSKGEQEEVLTALENLLRRGDVELDPQELSEAEMQEAQRRLDEEVAAHRAQVRK